MALDVAGSNPVILPQFKLVGQTPTFDHPFRGRAPSNVEALADASSQLFQIKFLQSSLIRTDGRRGHDTAVRRVPYLAPG